MVFESIKALKERNGSSIQAIRKHTTSSHPTLNFTPHQMRSALKKGTEAGKFVKVRVRPSSDTWQTMVPSRILCHSKVVQCSFVEVHRAVVAE